MGAIISVFRKEKTTFQLLENIEENIKNYEAYTLSTQEKQKRFVGNFLVISIGLYVIGFLVFYFVFFPPTWPERITYSTPLLLFPVLIIFLKKLVAWFFQRKLKRNSLKLKKLNDEKKKIIEKVMDKETYKVALEILNRFGDKTNGFSQRPQYLQTITPLAASTPNKNNQLVVASAKKQELNPGYKSPYVTPQSRQLAMSTPVNSEHSVYNRRQPQPPSNSNVTPARSGLALSQASQLTQYRQQQLKTRTPFPIINQNSKTVVEKMVDYLIGDGPNSRFAMICKECYSHNGMALQEEYEYTSFKCAFCSKLNPAPKQRTTAPKLLNAIGDNATPGGTTNSTPSTVKNAALKPASTGKSSSDSDSGSESDVSTTTENQVAPVIQREATNTEQINVRENNVNNEDESVERDTEQEEIIVNNQEKEIEEKKND